MLATFPNSKINVIMLNKTETSTNIPGVVPVIIWLPLFAYVETIPVFFLKDEKIKCSAS